VKRRDSPLRPSSNGSERRSPLPSYKLSELAPLVGGKILGEDVEISGINALELATEKELSFINSGRLLEKALLSRAGALLAPSSLAPKLSGKNLLLVPDVRLAVARIAWLFYERPEHPKGISPLAFVEESARVDPTASIYPFVYVGRGVKISSGVVLYPGVYVGERAEIGPETIIFPNAVIYPETRISGRVLVHAGAVIGSDGFGYAQDGEKHIKIPHFGRVEIGEEVEIGANTTIDRATFGITSLGEGTKLDNLIQVAHNVRLGRSCVLAAQVGITGSVEIEDFVMVGGQAGINKPVRRGALVAARAGVAREVPAGQAVAGAPAIEIKKWRRCVAAYERLPEMLRELKELRQKVARLEEVLNGRKESGS